MIDCMVALPPQFFYNTMIPACLWFLARQYKSQISQSLKSTTVYGRPQTWRNDQSSSAMLEEVCNNNYIFMAGRYVGKEEIEDDGAPFEQENKRAQRQTYPAVCQRRRA